MRCDFQLCKMCCRSTCYKQNKECAGHGFLLTKKRENKKRKLSNGEESAILRSAPNEKVEIDLV